MEVKIIVSAKINIVGILEHVFARIASKKNVFLILQYLHVIKFCLIWILY